MKAKSKYHQKYSEYVVILIHILPAFEHHEAFLLGILTICCFQTFASQYFGGGWAESTVPYSYIYFDITFLSILIDLFNVYETTQVRWKETKWFRL